MKHGVLNLYLTLVLLVFSASACAPAAPAPTVTIPPPTATLTSPAKPTVKPTGAPTMATVPPTATLARTPTATTTSTPSQEGRFIVPEDAGWFGQAHLAPNGQWAGISTQKKLYIFNTRLFKLAYAIDTPEGSAGFGFSPDGKQGAITLGKNQSIQLFDTATGNYKQVLKGDRQVNVSLLFSGDGSKLAGLSDSSAEIWDLKTSQRRNWFMIQGGVGKRSLSYTGETLAVANYLIFTGSGAPVPATNWMHSLGTLFTPLGLTIRTTGNVSPSFTVAHGPDSEVKVDGIYAQVSNDNPVVSSADENLVALPSGIDSVTIFNAFTGKMVKKDVFSRSSAGGTIYWLMDLAFTLDGKLLEMFLDRSKQGQDAFFIREVDLKKP